MHQIQATLSGNVAVEPRRSASAPGAGNVRTVMRVATTPRWQDRASGEWREGHPTFVTVVCWRALAENVAASVNKGDPVVVTGRLRMGTYTAPDGQSRQSVELHASAVGHDLTMGRSRFTRSSRAPTGDDAGGGEKTAALDGGVTGAASSSAAAA